MTHEIEMRDDGILRMALIGDVGKEDMEVFLKDYVPFLEAATEAEPLAVLVDSVRSGKLSSKARKAFAGMNRDPRLGKVANVRSGRYTRVLIGWVLKATGRDNLRFFDSEEEALAWLKAES